MAVGLRHVGQPERLRGHDGRGRSRVARSGQDVEDHVCGVDPLGQSLGAGRIDRRYAVVHHRREDLHHLAVTIRALQLPPHALHGCRHDPILEGCAILNRPGSAGGSNFQVGWSHDEQDDEQVFT